MPSENTVSVVRTSRTRIIAAAGLFGALSILLTTLSQALGLNFPVIPYLQFDFGEVAIILAFLFFGPVPAVFSAFVEFVTLMIIGQDVPVGPLFKIIAILSTIGGLWTGIAIAKRVSTEAKRGTILALSLVFGMIFRAAVMTVPNYLLVVGAFQGTVEYVTAGFRLLGISLTSSNALQLILGFTAIFNCLQLLLVFVIAYFLMRTPQLKHLLRSNRMAWFESFGKSLASTKQQQQQ